MGKDKGLTLMWRLDCTSNKTRQRADLLKSQKGKCSHCNMYFTSESLIEIHHVDGNHNNNKRTNLKAVHRHCHDIIHGKWETQVWDMRSDDSYQPIP